MYFVGQTRIRTELEYLVNSAITGKNYNVLFAAQSGMGKTTLGWILAFKIAQHNYNYYIPLEGSVKITSDRVQFIDEVHLVQPQELLYPLLDAKNKFYILATNEIGLLKQPLVRRCQPRFQFDPYTDEEAGLIFKKRLHIDLPEKFYKTLIEITKIPGEIDGICTRLGYILSGKESEEEFNEIIKTVLGIKDGISPHESAYLAALEHLGGRAGIRTISAYLRLPQEYIMTEVEPQLFYKNKIQITTRGRILCQ